MLRNGRGMAVENSYTLSSEHDYKNKVKASRSIFKFEDIDYQQARKLGLFSIRISFFMTRTLCLD